MKNFKKVSGLLYLSLVVLTLVFAFASCDKDDNKKVDNILKFKPDKVEVLIGKSDTVTVNGGTAPYTVVSSDSKIASAKVDRSTITITGVKDGSATVMVTDKDKNSGKITVTVKAASGLDFDKKSVTVNVGKEDVVTIKGGTAPYTAESKDSKIATASVKEGKVTIKGVKAGTTTITVADKDKKNSGSISVTIK
jgi:uncharacterized protein YjdB